MNIKCFINKYENIDKRTLKKHVRYVLTINGHKRVKKWIKNIGTNNITKKRMINQVYSNFFKGFNY